MYTGEVTLLQKTLTVAMYDGRHGENILKGEITHNKNVYMYHCSRPYIHH